MPITPNRPAHPADDAIGHAITPVVIDLTDGSDPVPTLHAALRTQGFVAIRNSQVSAALGQRALASARAYFAQSAQVKTADAYSDTNLNFGFQGLETEALDPKQALDEADRKEAFTMRSLNNRTQLPEITDKTVKQFHPNHPPFGATAAELFEACNNTALELLTLIARALKSEPDTFAAFHTGENMTLRYLHYPDGAHAFDAKNRGNQKKMPQLGAGAHTDYGTITLLFSDGVAGLQLYDVSDNTQDPADRLDDLDFLSASANKSAIAGTKRTTKGEGRWRNVVVAPGDVLVNTGDLMTLWSNGLYPSTLHRVLPRTEQPDRYSIAFFVDPDSKTKVSPLPSCIEQRAGSEKNPENSMVERTATNSVIAGEHIQARIEASQRALA